MNIQLYMYSYRLLHVKTLLLIVIYQFLLYHVVFTGEPVPRSLEGLFVYEEKSTAPPANDTIVVEQWTVIEV